MKLRKRISWLMGTLQRTLFPILEECWETALTDKEQQLVSILELIQVERFVPKSTVNQWLGRKLCGRESIARSFVAVCCANPYFFNIKLLYPHSNDMAVVSW